MKDLILAAFIAIFLCNAVLFLYDPVPHTRLQVKYGKEYWKRPMKKIDSFLMGVRFIFFVLIILMIPTALIMEYLT